MLPSWPHTPLAHGAIVTVDLQMVRSGVLSWSWHPGHLSTFLESFFFQPLVFVPALWCWPPFPLVRDKVTYRAWSLPLLFCTLFSSFLSCLTVSRIWDLALDRCKFWSPLCLFLALWPLQHHLLKRFSFSIQLPWHLCQKPTGHVYVHLSLNFLFCFRSICLYSNAILPWLL